METRQPQAAKGALRCHYTTNPRCRHSTSFHAIRRLRSVPEESRQNERQEAATKPKQTTPTPTLPILSSSLLLSLLLPHHHYHHDAIIIILTIALPSFHHQHTLIIISMPSPQSQSSSRRANCYRRGCASTLPLLFFTQKPAASAGGL